jgi:GGDEF domain-containing protein
LLLQGVIAGRLKKNFGLGDSQEMNTSKTLTNQPSYGAFANKVEMELNRAERYRVFVSLTVLDLGPAREAVGDKVFELMTDLVSGVKNAVRACDYVELIEGHCLAVLLPETPRQGAEIAARRLADIIQGKFSESIGQPIDKVIPVEIASYPDTAGAKTVTGFLEELSKKSRN